MKHMKTGFVCREPGSFNGHTTERTDGDFTVGFTAPRASPSFELNHFVLCFLDEQLHRILIRQPVTPGDGVHTVIIEAVVLIDDSSSPTFGSNRMAAHGVHFAHHGHTQRRISLRNGNGCA